jgi:diguanylate cyclase (GGDEF)-like protein/PAS domain S-box-containing protein
MINLLVNQQGCTAMTINILIVEDERIVARSLKMALEDLGYNVPAIVHSGTQVMSKVAEVRPNLILMDIQLGTGPDGIDVAQAIAQEFDIPIIYITAHSDEVTLNRAKQTQPLGYILKPFQDRDLRTAIETALYKHEMEHCLRKYTQWLSTILSSIGDGVIVTDTQARIMLLNPVAEALTGWSAADAFGKQAIEVFAVMDELSRKRIDNPFEQVMATGETFLLPENSVLVRKNGSEIPINDSLAPIKDVNLNGVSLLRGGTGQITGTVVIFRDATPQRTAAKRLHRHAFYDNLTGLSNRAWFRERLTDAVERVKRNPEYLFAVLLLDMDRFKVVNDSMGHEAGDQLLTATAERLTRSVRTIDTVSRLGGDEFAVLLENLRTEEEAFKVVRRIQDELSKSFNLSGNEVFSNASIGIVLSSIGYSHIDELVRDADIAMYRAKAKGKGRYEIFDTVMRDQVIAASQLEHDLRCVLKRGNLMVYYQPIPLASSATGFSSGQ